MVLSCHYPSSVIVCTDGDCRDFDSDHGTRGGSVMRPIQKNLAPNVHNTNSCLLFEYCLPANAIQSLDCQCLENKRYVLLTCEEVGEVMKKKRKKRKEKREKNPRTRRHDFSHPKLAIFLSLPHDSAKSSIEFCSPHEVTAIMTGFLKPGGKGSVCDYEKVNSTPAYLLSFPLSINSDPREADTFLFLSPVDG